MVPVAPVWVLWWPSYSGCKIDLAAWGRDPPQSAQLSKKMHYKKISFWVVVGGSGWLVGGGGWLVGGGGNIVGGGGNLVGGGGKLVGVADLYGEMRWKISQSQFLKLLRTGHKNPSVSRVPYKSAPINGLRGSDPSAPCCGSKWGRWVYEKANHSRK
jgi:hypothetical protein